LPKTFPDYLDIHTVVFDFDGVFTDNKVWVDQNGNESVRCDRGDGFAFDLVRALKRKNKFDIDFFILSKEKNPVVLMRAKKLNLECKYGVNDKLKFMQEYLLSKLPKSINPFDGLIVLGNDLNDLPLMRKAGFSVAPNDAHYKVKEISHLVLQQNGGEGVVRAFIEKLLGINNLTEEEIDELISNC
jgi:3-deoxy-D-manno-octulosonate 8-phosphate phosphatase (KDO 8-P phosphatase)